MQEEGIDEILENIEILIMEKRFKMETYKGARAHYTRLYMQEKEQLQIQQGLYNRIMELKE